MIESEFEIKVKEHNLKYQNKIKTKQIIKQQIMKYSPSSNFLYGLPFSVTSDIKPKKKIYHSRMPYLIIKETVKLLDDNTLSCNDIRKQIKLKFIYDISITSIRKWAMRYKPDKVWYIRKPSNFRIVSDIVRLSLRGNSLGEIASFIHQNHNVRMSHKSIRDIQNNNHVNIVLSSRLHITNNMEGNVE